MHSDLLLIIIVAAALVFDFTNGFHDTANIVASSISTGRSRRARPSRSRRSSTSPARSSR
jgi:hypothetical protein